MKEVYVNNEIDYLAKAKELITKGYIILPQPMGNGDILIELLRGCQYIYPVRVMSWGDAPSTGIVKRVVSMGNSYTRYADISSRTKDPAIVKLYLYDVLVRTMFLDTIGEMPIQEYIDAGVWAFVMDSPSSEIPITYYEQAYRKNNFNIFFAADPVVKDMCDEIVRLRHNTALRIVSHGFDIVHRKYPDLHAGDGKTTEFSIAMVSIIECYKFYKQELEIE